MRTFIVAIVVLILTGCHNTMQSVVAGQAGSEALWSGTISQEKK